MAMWTGAVARGLTGGVIQMAGWVLPDRSLLRLARRVAMRGRPRARRSLDHFMAGGGRPLTIDTAALLREDGGVRDELLRQIASQWGGGGGGGRVHVDQRCFGDTDWCYALGGSGFVWRCEGPVLVVALREAYRWSPGQDRITRPVHRAAARLARHDARAGVFELRGTATRLPVALAAGRQRDADGGPVMLRAALL